MAPLLEQLLGLYIGPNELYFETLFLLPDCSRYPPLAHELKKV